MSSLKEYLSTERHGEAPFVTIQSAGDGKGRQSTSFSSTANVVRRKAELNCLTYAHLRTCLWDAWGLCNRLNTHRVQII